MATAAVTSSNITLKGSTTIVTEFFGLAVNSILYQRGLYPPESFERRNAHGVTVLVSTHPGLRDYVSAVLRQLGDWLLEGTLQRLVLVVASVASGEVLERWVFNVDMDKADTADSASNAPPAAAKTEKEISSEIAAIIRQITASVTFLPLLDEPCTFDLLVYTDAASAVPSEWEESDARLVSGAESVRLRSFSTRVHKLCMAPRRGYDAPFPHVFTGRALYQLSLVPVSEARRFVPPQLSLVQLCGYTLGGLYLARYDDSPVGAFDEAVALAGLVWNPPTSCAWAAKVYVSNDAARRHGVREVGLPSRLAGFVREATQAVATRTGGQQSWWRRDGDATGDGGAVDAISLLDMRHRPQQVCVIRLPRVAAHARPGPHISLVLPNFSGLTAEQPALLRYALNLRARVRLVPPARVEPGPGVEGHPLGAVLAGRPLLTMAFDDMTMRVGQPTRATR